ncbi:MAG: hypothetical protein WC756_06755 [Taibaiella sp.]|jgi:hypothetical protein
MEPLQQIDLVFHFIKKTIGGSTKSFDIWEEVSGSEKITDKDIFDGIINRLIADGLISKTFGTEEGDFYAPTFNGLLFDGYAMERERSEQEKRRTDLLEKELSFHRSMNLKFSRSMNRLQKRVVCWTVILGVGTSIAAVYYLLEILKFFLCHPKVLN